ncbi:GIY-YIG nuclease family protein [Nostoc parmelioides]|uniref:GIY-YIG nuclease family protein n=1 Tax=Nostoc parmelioides FACHB-3921 TaxID=2692909 RepID=A0ABR8BMJ7_9NOSO|nr:GIY-YIG nuclease family protein [Nostoc parmelioides]MBD2255342.1 GIY-YIG nuclease family protein [Nostoc parmelioides FACHB-3921]
MLPSVKIILSEETLHRYRLNQGYVYLIHAEGTNRYKIGRSVNPIARFEQLKAQSPYPLRIIDSFWTPDSINDEKYFHEQYKEYRIFGEWFELTDYSETNINSLAFKSQEQLLGQYLQSVNSVKDSFYCFRSEAQKISDNIALSVSKDLMAREEIQSDLIFISNNWQSTIEDLLNRKFQSIFYEYLVEVNTLKSLQYICNFGIEQWADCVTKAFEKSWNNPEEITLLGLDIAMRGTLAAFVACLNEGLIV